MPNSSSLGSIKTIERVTTTLKGLLPPDHRLLNDLERLGEPLEGFGHILADWGNACLERLAKLPDSGFTYHQGGSRFRLSLSDKFPANMEGFELLTITLSRLKKIHDWLKSLVSKGDQELIPETDAELLSEQISIALGRLEPIPDLIQSYSVDALQTGDARWLRIGQDTLRDPDDPTDLGLG